MIRSYPGRSRHRLATAFGALVGSAMLLAGVVGPGIQSVGAVSPRDAALGPTSQKVIPNEPGRVPQGFAQSGTVTAFLELDAASTLSTYDATSAQGAATARAAAKAQLRTIRTQQNAVSKAAAAVHGTHALYLTHTVLAGVAVTTDASNLAKLTTIAGVRAIYPITPKSMSNSYAVPLQGAPQVWTAYGDLGANSTIAIIDSGIDYTHADFGGPGTAAAYQTALASDASPANPSLFPSSKIIGGYDFAGDVYDADPTSATYQPVPHPDPNPLDCYGHGSHVAGTAAGLGVTSTGATYTGPYNNSTPFASLRIGPGMAPAAKILSYKVFGCEGSTDLVGEALEMAADPNGDGDPSDHADVINMSLGADFGSPQDADALATNAAVDLGINVVVASGNGGDLYDVGGSPGNAVKAIAVANSLDAYNQIDSVHVTAPAGIAGDYGAERSVAYDWVNDPDLAGTLVALTQSTNLDGCDPLNAADTAAVAGKVAFLEWTDDDATRRCGSAARSANIVAAGGIGAVFADDEETFAAGITGSAVIPVVMVVQSAGDIIRAQLGAGVTVNGTSAGTFRQIIAGDDDKVNSGSSRGIRGEGNVKPDVTAVGTSVFSTAMGTGNEGVAFSGTSMATPMVAGLAALLHSAHPSWTPLQVKADIMNTADQDLYTGSSHTGTAYAPNRVGSGRIEAKAALDNHVLAYVVDDPGAVSVSFGPVAVTSPTHLTKTIRVQNTGNHWATYHVAYDPSTSVPGVAFVLSTHWLTVPPHQSRTFKVSLVAYNPGAMRKTIDPTMDLVQDGLPRNFLADASGRIELTSSGRPTLRVPVYAAPRPAATMTQNASMHIGGSGVGQITLHGKGVAQGSGSERVDSLVAGFELQATSGALKLCNAHRTTDCLRAPDEGAADIHYVGSSSDADLVYFAISTYAPWRTEASANEFDVYIDTNGDGQADAILFNTRLSATTDIFVTELFDLTTGTITDIEAINNVLGDVDTAEFDSDVLVMPVAIAALPGITTTNTKISYGILSFSSVGPGSTDSVGLAADRSVTGKLTLDTAAPGLTITGSAGGPSAPLWFDQPGTTLTVDRDWAAYAASHGKGLLLFHFQDKVGHKAQVVSIHHW